MHRGVAYGQCLIVADEGGRGLAVGMRSADRWIPGALRDAVIMSKSRTIVGALRDVDIDIVILWIAPPIEPRAGECSIRRHGQRGLELVLAIPEAVMVHTIGRRPSLPP